MTLNFDTICRTCMTQSQALMCIFDDSATNDIVSMLQSITSIQASKNDGLPENVCIACLSEINRAFSFKNRSERSEHTLRQYLNQFTTKSTTDNERISTDPALSETINDERYEMIEVDEEDIDHDDVDIDHDDVQANVSNSGLTDDSKIEEITDERVSNNSTSVVLDKRKVFVLDAMPSDENLSNAISVVYECHVCYETFDSISLSEQHMATFHASEKKYETTESIICPICNVSFEDTNDTNVLDQHIRENHSIDSDMNDEDFDYESEDVVEVVDETSETIIEESKDEIGQEIVNDDGTAEDHIAPVIVLNPPTESELNYNCEKCGGKFAKERSLNIHVKLNKCTIKSFECQICAKVFVRKKNLDSHMLSHNAIESSCKFCDEKFARADQLAIHVQTKHEPGRKYLCSYCWKGFNVSSSLKDHIRIHNGERPYLCSICGKGFSQSTNLNQHVMRHTKTKPYSCSICSYSFVSKGELDAHSRKHTGLHPFVCDVCGSRFTTSSSLVKHTRIHTGERPYACEYCPMRFAALGTLKNHTRTHNGARPFACSVCGRTFSQRSDCLSHQDTHSADKSFFCKQCYKSFHKKSGLRNHMKIHRKDCSEPVVTDSDVVTIANDEMKLTYVTEIYSTSDN